jgi:hypothetical protein
MRQELINLYASMRIAKAKDYVYGTPYFSMMTQLEELMTREEYAEANAQADKYFGIEPLYK